MVCKYPKNCHRGAGSDLFFHRICPKKNVRKMTPNYKMLLLSVLIIASGCRKDVDQFIIQPDDQPQLVTGSVLGKVWSPDGVSIEGAGVTLHGAMTLSGESGFFFLPDVSAPLLDGVLEVEKTGFFTAYHRLPWTAGGELHANVLLAPKTASGSVSNETGGQVELPGGFWMELPQQGLEYQTGDPFNGAALIYAYWINPSAPAFAQLAPNGSRGIDLAENDRYLTSYGVLALELTDENGLPLRTAPGKTLDLHFPVPVTLLSTAPAELSIWSFDTEKALWLEESTVALFDQYYSAKVASGLFWNVASSQPLVQVKGWIQLPDGSPARGALVRVSGTDGSEWAQVSTQNQGQFLLEIPGNSPGSLQVLDLCGNEQYAQALAGLPANVSLAPIQIEPAKLLQVQGSLLDCDEAPVSLGYVQVIIGENEVLLPLKDGSFSAYLPVCPGNIVTLIGFDLVRHYQTTPLSFPAGIPADAGNWILCNDAPEYLSFNLEGEVHFSSVPDLTVNAGVSTILEPSLGVSLSFEGMAPGTYPVLPSAFSLSDLTSGNTSSINLVVNISRYDPPGGYVIGSFNGMVTELAGEEQQVSGVFKLQRN